MIQLQKDLYQGSKLDVLDTKIWYYDVGIRRVLRVSQVSEREELFSPIDCDGFQYLWTPFTDRGLCLTKHILLSILHFAESNDGSLLVHCREGRNRSVIICAYLLGTIYGMKTDEIVNLIKEKHHNLCVYPELVTRMKRLTGYDFRGLLE